MRTNIEYKMPSDPDSFASPTSTDGEEGSFSPQQEELIALFDAVIKARYLNASRPTAVTCYHELLRRVRDLNRSRTAALQLQTPALSSLQRRLRQLDFFDRVKARFAENQERKHFRSTGPDKASSSPKHIGCESEE